MVEDKITDVMDSPLVLSPTGDFHLQVPAHFVSEAHRVVNNLKEQGNGDGERTSNESRESLAVSVAGSFADSLTIHYDPDENKQLGKCEVGDDGVMRVTLTPAVCR